MPPRRGDTITRDDSVPVGLVAVLAAALAMLADTAPTGNSEADLVLTAGTAFAVSWLGASAASWALVVSAGVSMVAAVPGPPAVLFLAIAALAGAVWVSAARRSAPPVRAAIAGACVNVVLRLEWDPRFLASAAVAAAVIVLIGASGFNRRSIPVRRRVWLAGFGLVIAAGFAVVGLAYASAQAVEPARSGYDAMVDGLDHVEAGRTEEAARSLDLAAEQLRSAHDELTSPFGAVSQVVPVIAQNRGAVVTLIDEAASANEVAADALRTTDLDRLRITAGTFDVDALADLAVPLRDLERAVSGLEAALGTSQSPWLVAPLATRLDEASDAAADASARADSIALAAERAPSMLGADDTRRYLLAFVNSGESRGTNGLIGNWSEISIREGAMALTASGRAGDLESTALRGLTLDASDDFLVRYGGLGASVDGTVSPDFWGNVTASPDLPSVGAAMRQMYAAAEERSVDGVFIVDPKGLAALIDLVGPVRLDELDLELTGTNTEQFLLIDQFRYPEADRDRLLEALTQRTVANLLTTDLPAARDLVDSLSTVAVNGHLSGWAARDEEQDLFVTVGMDAALPTAEITGTDAIAVTSFNTAANKIDSFLERSIEYTPVVDESTGEVSASLRVTIRNTAPPEGLGENVIGNDLGAPSGTSATIVDVFTELDVVAVVHDGVELSPSSTSELGYNVTSLPVSLPSGGTSVIELELTGNVGAGDYELLFRPQPLPQPDLLVVDARDVDGEPLFGVSDTVQRRTRFSRDGADAWNRFAQPP